MSFARERFEVREVIAERRVYAFATSARRYHDAVLMADLARTWVGGAWVVVDSHEANRVLFDSRLIAQKTTAADS